MAQQGTSLSDLLLHLALRTTHWQLPLLLKLESNLPTSNLPTSNLPTSNLPTSNLPTSNLLTSKLAAFNTYFLTDQQACAVVYDLWCSLHKPHTIANYCQKSVIGKKLPNALYVHRFALAALDPLLQLYESLASLHLKSSDQFTLVKFHTNQPKISYLFYPEFDTDPHPSLHLSIQVNLNTTQVNYQDYTITENSPILHRKETFLTPDYPLYQKFAQLTRDEEKFGLLGDQSTPSKSRIGTRKGWQRHLNFHHLEIQDHTVIKVSESSATLPSSIKIERHKAALMRRDLSKPVRLALEAELFTENTTFLDYGCGYGGDVQRMTEQGFTSVGWDPYYQPNTPLIAADIVNLGYVINVIESQQERREALCQAWSLTQKVLIVSAQVLIQDKNQGQIAYEDGIITHRQTFQKYYEQEELKSYIDQVLNVDSIPVALGIYFVFRDETQAQIFRASRFRSTLATPRIRRPTKRFSDYQEQLMPLMKFVSERGRLPVKEELAEESSILAEFRGFKRAFKIILQVTDPRDWEAIADKRRQDLLVYLALTHFSHRPSITQLESTVKNDIKGLFGSYQKACTLADIMLFSLGDPEIITDCCRRSVVGQKSSHALSIHVSALSELDPLLRAYEGCANRTIGRLDGATLIRFHTKTPKISYLFYPDFDTEPHPVLKTVMQIDLQNLQVSYLNYEGPSAPILHRKELCVMPDYPHYEKFAQLSRQEMDRGLLDDKNAIQTRQGWLKCLEDNCVEIRNNRLYWRADADPYRVKALKAAMRSRQVRRRTQAKS